MPLREYNSLAMNFKLIDIDKMPEKELLKTQRIIRINCKYYEMQDSIDK